MRSITKVSWAAFPLVFIALLAWRQPRPPAGREPYRPRESRVALNPDQERELLDPGRDAVAVYLALSAEGRWQVRHAPLGSPVPDARPIGLLFKSESGAPDLVPVYLCSYGGPGSGNLGLDLSPRCSGEGKRAQPEPVGYSVSRIRTGYLLAVRCRSESAGFYPSLNPACEAPGDRVQGSLGSFRAARVAR